MTAPAVRTVGLERRFGGAAVLAGVDLVVEAGELVVLLGANGAGKTTLLRVLATLLRPTGGRLELFGVDATRREAETLRRVGYVGHESACYPDLTGAENLAFYAELYRVPGAAARIVELLSWAGLEGAARRPVRVYSRGMQQRLALARAMLHAPDLLILDEPFSGLDPAAQSALDGQLIALRTAGHAIVLSTHDVARAAPLATRTAVLHRGRIAWTGPGAVDPVVLAQTYDDVTRRRA